MRIVLLIVFGFFVNTINAQINLNKLKRAATQAQEAITPTSLSKDEVAKGLKEALIVGATNSAENASEEGGFNNNLVIKIRFQF